MCCWSATGKCTRDREGETKNKQGEKGRKRKESEERKDAENKEKEKIEPKRWVARPIRGLSVYYMMKGRDQSFDIIVRQRVMGAYLPYRGETAQDGYASDEIYSLHILGLLWSIVNHSISIACYW